MKIALLYSDKATTLVTAQVLDTSDDKDMELDATLQFVNGDQALTFDFSFYGWRADLPGHADAERARLEREINAARRLGAQVAEFVAAFEQAGSHLLDRYDLARK